MQQENPLGFWLGWSQNLFEIEASKFQEFQVQLDYGYNLKEIQGSKDKFTRVSNFEGKQDFNPQILSDIFYLLVWSFKA